MARYASGDEAAFAELHALAGPRLATFLARRTRGDAALAEDLLQQTFLQIHAARSRFVPGAPVMPWAFAIARRLLIDEVRRQRRDPAASDPGPSEPACACPPDAPWESRELATLCIRALEELPAPQRRAYELARWDGLSLTDVAARLGTTPNAVKLRVHRTLKILRSALASGSAPRVQSLAPPSLRGARMPRASTRLDNVVRAMPSSRAA
jgi:RNA polymerase sigma-70 factor (ECF subfamily)